MKHFFDLGNNCSTSRRCTNFGVHGKPNNLLEIDLHEALQNKIVNDNCLALY